MTPSLHMVLQALYNSEINCTLSWFWDGGVNIALGDTHNGIRAAGNVDNMDEAARWLIDMAKKHFPDSEFANVF